MKANAETKTIQCPVCRGVGVWPCTNETQAGCDLCDGSGVIREVDQSGFLLDNTATLWALYLS